MNEDKLVSVIVPIYKVEQYMDNCVSSLINQNYKNLEIILVDDGSPDNCPKKCDSWCSKDNRIKVIHKENEGLSCARNSGLDVATGDYIAFVDSDDWIEPDMYQKFVDILNTENVDFVAGRILTYDDNTSMQIPFMEGKDYLNIKFDTILDRNSYLKAILSKKLESASWNKLFRRSAIGDIRFKRNRYFEDYLFMYNIASRMKSMCYLDSVCYNYRIRSNSICSSGLHLGDWEQNFLEIEQDLISHNEPQFIKHLNLYKVRHYQDLCKIFVADSKRFAEYRKKMLNVRLFFLKLPRRLFIKYILIWISNKWLINKILLK